MPTQYPDLFAALAARFGKSEIKTRVQGGQTLRYVTARVVMNRLDEVLGPEAWWDRYQVLGPDSVLCELTIRLPDGSTVTKADAGGCAGMKDAGDDDKSGFSDAFKRAAVKMGVGRYLYRDGVPPFVRERVGDRPSPPPEPAPPSPVNGHKAPPGGGGKSFHDALEDALAYWSRLDPTTSAKESERRSYRLVNAVCSMALEAKDGQYPLIRESEVNKPAGAGEEPRRDRSKVAAAVARLHRTEPEWVESALAEHVCRKVAETRGTT